MNKFSCLLSHLPVLPQGIIDEGISADFVFRERPYMINSMAKDFLKTKFMTDLESNLGNLHTSYFKTLPNTLYDWHTDPKREVAINWPLKIDPNMISLHRDNHRNIYYWDIEQVKYELYKPTLFDVKQDHCVINNTSEERIILSVSVLESSYSDTLAYLNSLSISEY